MIIVKLDLVHIIPLVNTKTFSEEKNIRKHVNTVIMYFYFSCNFLFYKIEN